MKKSFLIYSDYEEKFFRHLNETQTGALIKEMFKLHNNLNDGVEHTFTFKEPALTIAFEQIKSNMERDHQRWQKQAKRARENGKKGGRPKNEKNV